MTEATFESVKGKLEVIAPYLRHSHTVKITTIFPITTKHKIKKSTIIEKTNNMGKKEEKLNENEAYRSNCRIFKTYFFSIGQIAG